MHINNMPQRIINVSGYGMSGSSAVVDLLRGVNECSEFGSEFRIIKDPDGIIDLENALVNDWTHIKCDVAIKRFLKLTQELGGKSNRRYMYNERCNNEFHHLSEKYIQDLSDFLYNGSNTRTYIDKPIWERYVVDGCKKLNIKYPESNLRFSFPKKRFVELTKKYLYNIINSSVKNQDSNDVVLDQSIHPTQSKKSMKYFDSAKLILVTRDPRDMYIDSLGPGFVPNNTVDQFIKYYRTMHSNSNYNQSHPNILKIHFEDLVINHEATKQKLFSFLFSGSDERTVVDRHFQPKESVKNVGMYDKNIMDKQKIDRIGSSLSQYCYDLNNEMPIDD